MCAVPTPALLPDLCSKSSLGVHGLLQRHAGGMNVAELLRRSQLLSVRGYQLHDRGHDACAACFVTSHSFLGLPVFAASGATQESAQLDAVSLWSVICAKAYPCDTLFCPCADSFMLAISLVPPHGSFLLTARASTDVTSAGQ